MAAEPDPVDPFATRLADGSYEWYRTHAIRSRKAYKLSETLFVVLGAAIPVSVVIAPDSPLVPALLGAGVVVLTGLRSVFHWQENYLRFSVAREALDEQRRLYSTHAAPYQHQTTRDQLLAAAVTRIEQEEMRAWVELAHTTRDRRLG
ncbi:MAG: DUF4231 domain-containing protein [Thermoleophilia bacterium]